MADWRFALIIANYQYEDTNLQKLEAPAYDARALEVVLKNPEIAGFVVTPLINESAATIRREIARLFAKKGRDDLLLLYFSGHGVVDKRGRLYLAVRDTNLDLLSGSAIEAVFITDEMNNSNSRRQLLILDCCNSGAFERGMKGAQGVSVGTCDAFKGTGVGRFVLTATDSTQYAWEGDNPLGEAKNSVFTHYLIKGLQGEAADDNGEITFDSLYDYVHDKVAKETPKQTPCKWTYKQEGKLIIARAHLKPTELSPDLIDKINNTDYRVRKIAVDDLDRMLHSSRKGLALAAYNALKLLSEDDSRMISKAAEKVLATCPDEIRTFVSGSTQTIKTIEVEEIKGNIKELSIAAQHLFDEGKYHEAIEKWNEVLKLDFENGTAKEGIEKAKEEEKKGQIFELSAEAQRLSRNGRHAEAIDKWNEVLNLDPENQNAIEGIKKAKEGDEKKRQLLKLSKNAQILFENKNFEKAIATWQEILKLDSKNTKAIEGIEESKRILKELKEKKKNEKELKEKKKIDREKQILDSNSHAQRLFETGKFEYAIIKWQEVLNLDPENSEAIEGIKKSKILCEEEKEKKNSHAQRLFENGKLIAKSSSHVKEYFKKGNFENAIVKWKESNILLRIYTILWFLWASFITLGLIFVPPKNASYSIDFGSSIFIFILFVMLPFIPIWIWKK